jgi:hypothetical protein
MSINFSTIFDLCPGKYYKLLKFKYGIKIIDIANNITSIKNIENIKKLGKLLEINEYNYFYFEDEVNGKKFYYKPLCTFTEAYQIYEYNEEENSKLRIYERNNILKNQILGNDWALRPENVIYTQGIDTSNFL